jgi:uncharacterized protein (DUF697 family)/tellurite resistance protein
MMTEDEALAGIRVLAAVAQADGEIAPAERALLADALSHFGAKLPDGETVDAFLDRKVDVAAEAAKLKTPAAKDAVFQAAIGMAKIDGTTKESEQKVLTQMRAAFGLDLGTDAAKTALDLSADWAGIKVEPIQDAAVREVHVEKRIRREAFYSALFAVLPVPFLSEVLITLTQVGLISGISTYYGHPLTRKERLAIFAPTLALAGLATALHSVTKLVPFWGTVAAGAIVYGTTFGLGRAVKYYFDSEGKATSEDIRKVFLSAKAEGKASYADEKKKVEAVTKEHGDELAALAKDLSDGKIDAKVYEEKVAKLTGQE